MNSTQTGTFSWGTVSLGSNGTTNACTTPTAGTFLLAPSGILPTTSTVAAGLAAAVNLCTNSGVGAGTVTANAFTVTNTVLGYSTFAGLTGIVTVSATSAGTNGTTACTFPNGTFALAASGTIPTTALEIAQLKTALTDCGAGTGVTGGTVAGSSLPVTDNSLGYDTSLTVSSTQTGTFSWGAVSLWEQRDDTMLAAPPPLGRFSSPPPAPYPPPRPWPQDWPPPSVCAPPLGGWRRYCNRQHVHGYRHRPRLCNLHRSDGYVTVSATLGGGTNGTTACTFPNGTFALAANGTTIPTTALEIAQLKIALTDCGAGTGVTGGTVTGSSLPVTDNSLGYDTTLTVTSTQTGTFSWGAVSYGSNGTRQCLRHPHRWDLYPRRPRHLTHHLDRGIRTDHGPRYVRRQYGCWL